MRTTDRFIFFWGYKDFMSNFYYKPFHYKGKTIICSEVGFMLEKALQFGDIKIMNELASVEQAKDAKALGRKIRNYDDDIWNNVRKDRMVEVLTEKFKDVELREKLLSTGNHILVEASPIDKIWGIGLDENNPDAEDESKWRGENLLGIALMSVRADLLRNSKSRITK